MKTPTTLILTTCFTLLIAVAPGRASGQTVWELTPYKIEVLLAMDDSPEFSAAMATDIAHDLVTLAEASVGAVWDLHVHGADGELRSAILADPGAVTLEMLPGESLLNDKVVLLRIRSTLAGYEVRGRELDVRTQQFGPVVGRTVGQPVLLGAASLRVVREVFSPLAQVGTVEGDRVVLRLQGGGFYRGDKALLEQPESSIFLPVVRYEDRLGKVRGINVLPWTYLRVEAVAGAEVECRMHTGLRSPLSARRRGRVEQLALLVKPRGDATILTLKSRTDSSRVLTDYEVLIEPSGEELARPLGMTDRNGQIRIPVGDDPLQVLLVRHGSQMLARLPMIPGAVDRMDAEVMDDQERLMAEGLLRGYQEMLVDIVTQREVLLVQTRMMIEAGDYEKARELVGEMQKLTPREKLSRDLTQEETKLNSSDPIVQQRISAMFDSTRKLVAQYLDPAPVNRIREEVYQLLRDQTGEK